MTKEIYYLTGMGGRLYSGLGKGLLDKGFKVDGRELYGDFKKLRIQQQIDIIAEEINRRLYEGLPIDFINNNGVIQQNKIMRLVDGVLRWS